MSESRSYRDLIVWQKAVDWVTHVYRVSSGFPSSENFGITSHLRRAAVSVPADIAEGHGRSRDSDYPKFLRYSLGSPNETETHLEVAIRFGYLENKRSDPIRSEAEEIRRRLSSLIRRLEERTR